MAVKTSKLWSEPWFMKQPALCKLVYLYCATRPGINTLGLFVSSPEEIVRELQMPIKMVNDSLRELLKEKQVLVKQDEGLIWFWVTGYVKGFPRRGNRFETGVRQYDKLPLNIKLWVRKHLPPMKIVDAFKAPSPEEISQYALQEGYLVDGEEFVKYYSSRGWKDTRGKKVRNWKTKVRQVWCKDDRKIEPVKGAPEGMEYFHVVHEGRVILPKAWRGGLPYGESIGEDKLLQSEYKNKNN